MLKIADNKIADVVDELKKTRLIDECAQFGQSIVDATISQWRRRPSTRFRKKHRLRNDLNCVEWDVKPCSTNPCTRGTLSINCVNFENDCFTNL